MRAVRASLLIDINSWMATEILVSYEAGFVRRGLLGQALLAAREYGLELEPKYLLAFFGFLAWGVVGMLLERWSRCMEAPGRIFILFSPLLAFFPLLDTDSFPRKDIVAVAFTVAHLLCLKLAYKSYTKMAAVGFLILAPLATLTHEAFVFLALPINLILFFFATRHRVGVTDRSLLMTVAIALPSIVAFMAAVTWKGDASHAAIICSKWSIHYSSLKCNPLPGSFRAIASSADPFIRIVAESLGTRRFIYSSVLTLAYMLYHFIWLGKSYVDYASRSSEIEPAAPTRPSQGLRSMYFYFPGIIIILCLLASSPLYTVAFDYNRWLGVVVTCATLALVSPDFLRVNSFLIGDRNSAPGNLTTAFQNNFGTTLRSSANLFYKSRNLSLLFSFIATVPHCCVVFLVRGDGALLSALKWIIKVVAKIA